MATRSTPATAATTPNYTGPFITVAVLFFIFGFIKGRFTGARPVKSALQTCLIGSVAAAAAFFIARLIGG